MRTRKFRAWTKKVVDNKISLPIDKAFREYEMTEDEARREGKFDEWYDARNMRVDYLRENFETEFPNTKDFTTTYEMLYKNVSISLDGKLTRPYKYEVLGIMDYVEILDAYEGDILYGKETDEYGTLMSSWRGVIKYNEDCGRIMIFDMDVDEWFEVDDFSFDEVQTINILDIK